MDSVNPSELLVGDGLFGVHVPPVLALCALFGLAARGLEYDFGYEDGGNCPRECKSPMDAVVRRTPILDKSAMSSIAARGMCGSGG